MVNTEIVTAFINALIDKFENKQTNKKDDISGDFSTDSVSYPTVKSVKNYISGLLSGKADTTHAHGNITSDGKVGATSGKPLITGTGGAVTAGSFGSSAGTFVEGNDSRLSDARTPTSHNHTTTEITDFPSSMTPTSHTHGSVTNDGKIGSASGKIVTTGTGGALQASDSITKSMISDFPSSMTPTSHIHGDISNDGKIGSASGKPLITTTGGKIATGNFGTSSGQFAEGNHNHDGVYLKTHQSLSDIGGVVTVEQQSTAETGFAKTYVVKQGGTQVGSKINIPKDFLVKSATVETCATANVPVQGYVVGDKYIDFVINAKDSSSTDEHLYLLVSDLIDTYTAGAGLTLSGNQFSISSGAISKAMLVSAVQTSLGYADNWNTSAAKNITSTDITNWNNAISSTVTISDVDSEIEDYLEAITDGLTN